MKKKFFSAAFFAVIFFTSCDQHSTPAANITAAPAGADSNHISNKKSGNSGIDSAQAPGLEEYNYLVPVEILNANSKDVYKKYGIEFSGNCYACDLASIKINKKHFDIINVCDKNDFQRYEDFSLEFTGKRAIIKTGKLVFTFTKTDAAPVYELKISGDKISLKNKRISRFYTQEKMIKKFEQHDCGDFQG